MSRHLVLRHYYTLHAAFLTNGDVAKARPVTLAQWDTATQVRQGESRTAIAAVDCTEEREKSAVFDEIAKSWPSAGVQPRGQKLKPTSINSPIYGSSPAFAFVLYEDALAAIAAAAITDFVILIIVGALLRVVS